MRFSLTLDNGILSIREPEGGQPHSGSDKNSLTSQAAFLTLTSRKKAISYGITPRKFLEIVGDLKP
jgi:hypothetical protein